MGRFAERSAEEIAGVAEAKDSPPTILENAGQPKAAFQHMKDVPGRVALPEDRPRRRERLGDLRTKESLSVGSSARFPGPEPGGRRADRGRSGVAFRLTITQVERT